MTFNESNHFIIRVLYSFGESRYMDILSNLKIVFKSYQFELIGNPYVIRKIVLVIKFRYKRKRMYLRVWKKKEKCWAIK